MLYKNIFRTVFEKFKDPSFTVSIVGILMSIAIWLSQNTNWLHYVSIGLFALGVIGLCFSFFIKPKINRRLEQKIQSLILERKAKALAIPDMLSQLTILERTLLSANKIEITKEKQKELAQKLKDHFKFILPKAHDLHTFTREFKNINLKQLGIKDTLMPNDPEIEFLKEFSYFLSDEIVTLFEPIKTNEYQKLSDDIYRESNNLTVMTQTEIGKYRNLSLGVNIYPTFMNMFPNAQALTQERFKPGHPYFDEKINTHLSAYLKYIREMIEGELRQ